VKRSRVSDLGSYSVAKKKKEREELKEEGKEKREEKKKNRRKKKEKESLQVDNPYTHTRYEAPAHKHR